MRINMIAVPPDHGFFTVPHLVSVQDGERLYKAIHKLLRDQAEIVIDFTGVKTLTLSFLSPAIGKLLSTWNLDHIRSVIDFVGCTPYQENLIDQVLRNSAIYYSLSKQEQRVQDEIVRRCIDES